MGQRNTSEGTALLGGEALLFRVTFTRKKTKSNAKDRKVKLQGNVKWHHSVLLRKKRRVGSDAGYTFAWVLGRKIFDPGHIKCKLKETV